MSSTHTYTTQELLEHIHLHYTYEDGKLISNRYKRPVGANRRYEGYIKSTTVFKGRKLNFRVHQWVFLVHHGYLPDFVDHINGDVTDNHIENLRACTSQQNSFNRKQTSRNKSGFKGVSRLANTTCTQRPWRADIRINGKNVTLGHFATPEEAAAAYQAAAREHFGEFARSLSNKQ